MDLYILNRSAISLLYCCAVHRIKSWGLKKYRYYFKELV